MPLPKIIHYCWFGGGKKSELIEKCIDSWRKYAPECEIVEWNESNYDVTKNRYMREAYEAKRWGFVSDYARLDIICENGGIYFDTDVELIRPIKDLEEGTGFIGFEQVNASNQYAVNTGGGFGAEKQDPVIASMRDFYEELSFENENGAENLQPCPLYNTTVMNSFGLKCDNSLQRIGNITVYPYDRFCPINWKTHRCETTQNTYSIHHFDASWLSAEEKKRRKKERRIDSIKHLPNRLVRGLVGEKHYEALKRYIKNSE